MLKRSIFVDKNVCFIGPSLKELFEGKHDAGVRSGVRFLYMFTVKCNQVGGT